MTLPALTKRIQNQTPVFLFECPPVPLQAWARALRFALHGNTSDIHNTQSSPMKHTPLEELTLAGFEAALETTLRVLPDTEAAVDLVLTEATGKHMQGDGGEHFSIIFKGSPVPLLPQRIYSLEHDIMGRFDLFLVPVGQDETGIQCQAAFNRPAGAS